MRKTVVAKTDVLVALACMVFLLANLGAVGNGGRRRAKEAVCVANLKRWGTVWLTFANDNAGYFMPRSGAAWWIETIIDNCGSSLRPKMWLCPEATRTWNEGGLNPHLAWSDSYDDTVLKGSYCLNLWISNEIGSGKVGGGAQEFWRTPYVAGAENVPVFADGQWKDADPVVWDHPSPYETDLWTPNHNEMQRVCVSRHNGGVNMLYLDFSVRKVGLKFLWRQPWHRTFDLQAPLPQWPYWMQNFKDP